MTLTFNPNLYNVNDIAEAMRITVTPEDSTTEERWKNETPYLADLITQSLEITSQSLVLDYGCGLGRIAKELITRHGCRVIGIDTSPSMRSLSPTYVASDKFFACPPTMLDQLIELGVTFDGAMANWVLQHSPAPAQDIARIQRALRQSGRLFVINGIGRCVPTFERGYINDGIDLRKELGLAFSVLAEGKPAVEHTTPNTAKGSFWAVFRLR